MYGVQYAEFGLRKTGNKKRPAHKRRGGGEVPGVSQSDKGGLIGVKGV